MSYKTILVHVDHSPHCEGRMRAAASIALEHQGHLIGAAMSGMARVVYEDGSADLGLALIAAQMGALRARAETALANFAAIATSMGVSSFEPRMVDDDPEGGLALQARYADLVVVSQPDPEDVCSRLAPGLPSNVMLASGRPLLVVPHSGSFSHIGRRVLLAWDGNLEATRAVACALPLLRRAGAVSVAIFNPGVMHGAQPGADIALYLARHGVKVDVNVHQCDIEVGEALLSLAADQQSDLIVMGGYGHTRFRELMLGGVTRTVLRSMTAPVLMAH
ncbi:MAG: universal stress protein [Pseudomonadota bacterium]